MTPGELRSMRWAKHDFVTLVATAVDGGAPAEGAFCTRCQMFAPVGMHFPVAPCRPGLGQATSWPTPKGAV